MLNSRSVKKSQTSSTTSVNLQYSARILLEYQEFQAEFGVCVTAGADLVQEAGGHG